MHRLLLPLNYRVKNTTAACRFKCREKSTGLLRDFFVQQKSISEILVWDRNCYLIPVILPRLSWEGCSLVVMELMHMIVKWQQCSVKVTSSWNNASQRIQGILEAYFKINSLWWARNRICYMCEGVIEKSVPRDHCMLSLGKPRDNIEILKEEFFLSHTHDEFK